MSTGETKATSPEARAVRSNSEEVQYDSDELDSREIPSEEGEEGGEEEEVEEEEGEEQGEEEGEASVDDPAPVEQGKEPAGRTTAAPGKRKMEEACVEEKVIAGRAKKRTGNGRMSCVEVTDNSDNVKQVEMDDGHFIVTHLPEGLRHMPNQQAIVDNLSKMCNSQIDLFSIRWEREQKNKKNDQLRYNGRSFQLKVNNNSVVFFTRDFVDDAFSGKLLDMINEGVDDTMALIDKRTREARRQGRTFHGQVSSKGTIVRYKAGDGGRYDTYPVEYELKISNWHVSQRYRPMKEPRDSLTAQIIMYGPMVEGRERHESTLTTLTSTPADLAALFSMTDVKHFIANHVLKPFQFGKVSNGEGGSPGAAAGGKKAKKNQRKRK